MTLPSDAELPSALTPAPEIAPPSTARNVVFITTGRVSLVAVWFAATVLMARVLGKGNFGLYTLCTRAIGIVTGCFGDPLDMAVMRQAPLYLTTDRPRAVEIIRSAFWLRVGVGSLSIIIAAAVPWLVSLTVFGSRNFHNLAMLTALGILGDLLLRSALGYFQASEKFAGFMFIDCVWQLGRAITAFAFIFFHMLRVETAILLYVALPYLGFITATLILPSDVMRLRSPSRGHMLDILHYSKWMVAALMMAAIYERLDVFLLNHFRGIDAVGIYGVAMMLAVIPDFVDGGIQTVLGPKVAPAHAAGEFHTLQRKYLFYSIPLGIAVAAAAMIIAGPIIRIFFGARYLDSAWPFRILVLGTLFNIVFTPLPAALLNYVAPKKVALLTMIGLFLVAVGGWEVIPRYGIIGAAIVILSARIVIGSLIVFLAGRISSPDRRTS